MFVPAAWTGRLVLYAHGFIDPAAPIALPDVAPADVAPWVMQLRETLLSQGYAVAYSSYSENGWAVQDGAARTHELRDLFSQSFGAPTQVYVTGRSLGARSAPRSAPGAQPRRRRRRKRIAAHRAPRRARLPRRARCDAARSPFERPRDGRRAPSP